jgi:hypothetical protein
MRKIAGFADANNQSFVTLCKLLVKNHHLFSQYFVKARKFEDMSEIGKVADTLLKQTREMKKPTKFFRRKIIIWKDHQTLGGESYRRVQVSIDSESSSDPGTASYGNEDVQKSSTDSSGRPGFGGRRDFDTEGSAGGDSFEEEKGPEESPISPDEALDQIHDLPTGVEEEKDMELDRGNRLNIQTVFADDFLRYIEEREKIHAENSVQNEPVEVPMQVSRKILDKSEEEENCEEGYYSEEEKSREMLDGEFETWDSDKDSKGEVAKRETSNTITMLREMKKKQEELQEEISRLKQQVKSPREETKKNPFMRKSPNFQRKRQPKEHSLIRDSYYREEFNLVTERKTISESSDRIAWRQERIIRTHVERKAEIKKRKLKMKMEEESKINPNNNRGFGGFGVLGMGVLPAAPTLDWREPIHEMKLQHKRLTRSKIGRSHSQAQNVTKR